MNKEDIRAVLKKHNKKIFRRNITNLFILNNKPKMATKYLDGFSEESKTKILIDLKSIKLKDDFSLNEDITSKEFDYFLKNKTLERNIEKIRVIFLLSYCLVNIIMFYTFFKVIKTYLDNDVLKILSSFLSFPITHGIILFLYSMLPEKFKIYWFIIKLIFFSERLNNETIKIKKDDKSSYDKYIEILEKDKNPNGMIKKVLIENNNSKEQKKQEKLVKFITKMNSLLLKIKGISESSLDNKKVYILVKEVISVLSELKTQDSDILACEAKISGLDESYGSSNCLFIIHRIIQSIFNNKILREQVLKEDKEQIKKLYEESLNSIIMATEDKNKVLFESIFQSYKISSITVISTFHKCLKMRKINLENIISNLTDYDNYNKKIGLILKYLNGYAIKNKDKNNNMYDSINDILSDVQESIPEAVYFSLFKEEEGLNE